MDSRKQEAFKLRRKGFSYNEINKKLGIPKSTLSGWFKGFVLSETAEKRLNKRKGIGTEFLIKRNKNQTKKAWQRVGDIKRKAKHRIDLFSKRDLLFVGVSLYWAEGHKKLQVRNGREIPSHAISLTNSDPELARLFVLFLEKVLHIARDDIYFSLRLYDHINRQDALKYWSHALGLSMKKCRWITKQVSISSKRKRPFNRLPFGTIEIRVNSTSKFHELMGLIEGIKEARL